MKRFIALGLIAMMLVGCAKQKMIDGQVVKSYGLISEHVGDDTRKRKECVDYEVCWGNVIWGCIFIETIIAPIYFFGFSMFQPVGKTDGCDG